MPSATAASACVHLRWPINSHRWCASSALASASPGFGNLRSAKTLPELAWTLGSDLAAISLSLLRAPFRIMFLRRLQPTPNKFNLGFGRLDPSLRFLLKGVQHVNRARKPNGVH